MIKCTPYEFPPLPLIIFTWVAIFNLFCNYLALFHLAIMILCTLYAIKFNRNKCLQILTISVYVPQGLIISYGEISLCMTITSNILIFMYIRSSLVFIYFHHSLGSFAITFAVHRFSIWNEPFIWYSDGCQFDDKGILKIA